MTVWIVIICVISSILFLLALILMFDAHRKNKIKSSFLANMSHEMRTPMNAILGIAEIQMHEKNIKPDTMKALEKIYESGDLLLNIINDILDISKIEAGKLEIIPVKYEVPVLINNTAQLNRLRYEDSPIEFSINIDENIPNILFGDELRIKQVLNNILSNAFKYTEKGIVELSVSCEANSKKNEDDISVIFCVSDTGQGMTKKQIYKLFDEYERFNTEANRAISGTGLGMSITKRLVDLMNGSIYIQSELNKGTIFTVCIPQKRIGTDVCGAEVKEKLRDFSFYSTSFKNKTMFLREYMPYGNVLVVDDTESNIYVSKGMLAPYGLNIDTVSSGFEAIEKIKNGKEYDIIFMDHMMPKMDGIEAVKIIRELGYNNNIIALTANALIGRAEMFLSKGFNGFISKPIDSRELNLMLNELIRNKKPPEVVEAARQLQREGKTETISVSEQRLIMAIINDAENALNIMVKLNSKIHELSEEERNLYIITAHGLKSAFANIDEKELSSFAKELEIAGNEKNIGIMAEKTSIFINELQALIKRYLPPDDEVEIAYEDAVFLREKLIVIKTACEEIDKKTANDALESIIEKKWPKHVYFVLDEIAMHILHSSFKKAAAAAEGFVSRSSPTRGTSVW